RGSVGSARATRTRSRAAPRSIDTRQASQWGHRVGSGASRCLCASHRPAIARAPSVEQRSSGKLSMPKNGYAGRRSGTRDRPRTRECPRCLTRVEGAGRVTGPVRLSAFAPSRKQWEPVAFASPSLFLIAVVILFPLAYAFYLSLLNFDLSVGPDYEFVGVR